MSYDGEQHDDMHSFVEILWVLIVHIFHCFSFQLGYNCCIVALVPDQYLYSHHHSLLHVSV